MNKNIGALKHIENESCYAVEDGAPTKQSRTMTDDIVFRNRDADGVEAPTIDPLVISTTIGSLLYERCLSTVGVRSIFCLKKLTIK